MISGALIKHIRALHQQKFREEYRQFIAEGVKVVSEMLQASFTPLYVCATEAWISSHAQSFNLQDAEVIKISPAALERISAMKTPNSVLVVFAMPDAQPLPAISNHDLLLALDGIRDPGNMGTIIRIADWFGVRDVVCSDDCVEIYNPKTIQSTMGSISRVKVHYTELDEFFLQLSPDVALFSTDLEGENIYTARLPEGGLVVIGSESHGISERLKQTKMRRIFIPPAGQQAHAESLNAAVATGIICSEFRRRTAPITQ